MLTIIQNIDVFAPESLGQQDVLICDGRIAAIGPQLAIEAPSNLLTRIDGSGRMLLPGLVDSLVHISGGGGEGGFHTRTPQMPFTDATLGGVTTVIGALGTDATTRTLPDLLAKARGLEIEGISVYCYTGSYQLPARTISANVTDDIVLFDKFIGIGEVAIADHRSSQPSVAELARVASEARIGGMLSGKAGIVSIHVGEGSDRLDLLHQVTEQSNIPASQFYPTHINRNQTLLEAGWRWARKGGYIDFTTSTNEQFIEEGEIPAAKALADSLKQGLDISCLTMSSDGNASLPVFDQAGELIGLEVGQVKSLYQSMVSAIQDYGVSVSEAVASVTRTPADILKLYSKGRVEVGADADVLVVNADDLTLEQVYGKGKLLVADGKAVVTGTFG